MITKDEIIKRIKHEVRLFCILILTSTILLGVIYLISTFATSHP